MLGEELRSNPMHLGSLIMNGRRMLMRPDMPALTVLVQTLPVGLVHHPSFSREAPDIRPDSDRDSSSSDQRQVASTGDSA